MAEFHQKRWWRLAFELTWRAAAATSSTPGRPVAGGGESSVRSMAGESSTPALISDARSGEPPLEARPPGEVEAIAEAVRIIEAQVRAAAQREPARRDAHPKAHGCVKA